MTHEAHLRMVLGRIGAAYPELFTRLPSASEGVLKWEQALNPARPKPGGAASAAMCVLDSASCVRAPNWRPQGFRYRRALDFARAAGVSVDGPVDSPAPRQAPESAAAL